jgi:hypothetical protein
MISKRTDSADKGPAERAAGHTRGLTEDGASTSGARNDPSHVRNAGDGRDDRLDLKGA